MPTPSVSRQSSFNSGVLPTNEHVDDARSEASAPPLDGSRRSSQNGNIFTHPLRSTGSGSVQSDEQTGRARTWFEWGTNVLEIAAGVLSRPNSPGANARVQPAREYANNTEGAAPSPDPIHLYEAGWHGTPRREAPSQPIFGLPRATSRSGSPIGGVNPVGLQGLFHSPALIPEPTTHTPPGTGVPLASEPADWSSWFSSACIKGLQLLSLRNLSAQAPVNSSGLKCIHTPEHTAYLSSNSAGADYKLALHGHERVFSDVPGNSPVNSAISNQTVIAQSPDHVATDFGVAGSESRLTPELQWVLYAAQNNKADMIQFVSRISHRDGRNQSEVPLIEQIRQKLSAAQSAETGSTAQSFIKLNERFSITALTDEDDFAKFSSTNRVGCRTVKLQMSDSQGAPRIIRLTQVAPPFEKRLLTAADLQTSYRHLQDLEVKVDSSVVFSYAGVGRNASLTVYDQLVKGIDGGQIQTEQQLEMALKDLVQSGKQIRSEHFVQSAKQVEEIYRAALNHLNNRIKSQVHKNVRAIFEAVTQLPENQEQIAAAGPRREEELPTSTSILPDHPPASVITPGHVPSMVGFWQGRIDPSAGTSNANTYAEAPNDATGTMSRGLGSERGYGALPSAEQSDEFNDEFNDEISSWPATPVGSRRSSLDGSGSSPQA